jgi:hypothetical protein
MQGGFEMKDTYPSQCPRCLKHLGIRYDDPLIHTCTPTAAWREMEQENKRLRDALIDVLRRIENSEEWWMNVPDRGGFDTDMIEAALKETK